MKREKQHLIDKIINIRSYPQERLLSIRRFQQKKGFGNIIIINPTSIGSSVPGFRNLEKRPVQRKVDRIRYNHKNLED
jgi:hypothetical protein